MNLQEGVPSVVFGILGLGGLGVCGLGVPRIGA